MAQSPYRSPWQEICAFETDFWGGVFNLGPIRESKLCVVLQTMRREAGLQCVTSHNVNLIHEGSYHRVE